MKALESALIVSGAALLMVRAGLAKHQLAWKRSCERRRRR